MMDFSAIKCNDHLVIRWGSKGTQIAIFKRWASAATAKVMAWRKNSRTWTKGEVRIPSHHILSFATPRELQQALCPCGFACTHGYTELNETAEYEKMMDNKSLSDSEEAR